MNSLYIWLTLNQGIMFKNYIQQHKKKTNCKSLKLISRKTKYC